MTRLLLSERVFLAKIFASLTDLPDKIHKVWNGVVKSKKEFKSPSDVVDFVRSNEEIEEKFWKEDFPDVDDLIHSWRDYVIRLGKPDEEVLNEGGPIASQVWFKFWSLIKRDTWLVTWVSKGCHKGCARLPDQNHLIRSLFLDTIKHTIYEQLSVDPFGFRIDFCSSSEGHFRHHVFGRFPGSRAVSCVFSTSHDSWFERHEVFHR